MHHAAFQYPGGYYFPAESIQVRGYEVVWIELYGGAQGDAPTARPTEARLTIERLGDHRRSRYDCSQPVIAADTVNVYCPRTPIGSFQMGGAFNWRVLTVEWWQVPSFVEHQVILNAQVTIQSRNASVFSRRLGFSYWEGE